VAQKRRRTPAHKRSTKLARKLDVPAETLELEITDLSATGSGVSRDASGRVVFVPFTLPGDRALARVKSVSKRYAQAELLEVLKPSPDRKAPRCPVFGRCGGCQWQHVPYELQFRTKARGLLHALKRRGIEPSFPLDELPAEQVWEYRNRVQLRGEGERLGFFAPGSHEIIPIDRCDIARPEINAALGEARREGVGRGAYKLELDVSETGELRWAWNMGHSALGFRQVHDGQNAKLREWVSSRLTKGRLLLDLFGGSGNLSRPLASQMREVHCVDIGAPVSGLTETPIQFHRETVKAWLKQAENGQLASRARTAGGASAILDPPREGLAADFDSIERSLKALGVVEVVAVGCDGDAWAQDLSRFLKRGWNLVGAAALDLFPQTPHVEGIALLRL
jgi:tRNA/tmRNA/rRNA uracil-C5-methylase (TrmA/RlmC/RlmD family)